MSEAEREHVVDVVSTTPDGGTVIPGTGGLRKMRIALQGRGKRGGGRVIYWFHSERFPVVLMLAFGKNEKDDMDGAERKILIRLIDGLTKDFGG